MPEQLEPGATNIGIRYIATQNILHVLDLRGRKILPGCNLSLSLSP